MSRREPSGWDTTTLGDIAQNIRPRDKPAEHPDLRFIGMDNVEAHTMKLLGTVPATSMKSAAVHFQPGDVLYGRLRPYLNKVLEVDFEGLASAEFIPLTASPGIVPSFVRYRLNAADFVAFTSRLDEGDRPRVDYGQIAEFSLELPPTGEQTRIVEALDSYLSRLDAAQAALKRAQANLNRYRSSVLQAAVEGRLVPTEAQLACDEGRDYEPADALLERILVERRQRWEEAELAKMRAKGKEPKSDKWKSKYKEPSAPDTTELPELPEGWCWATWDQIGFSQNGRAFPSKEYAPTGIRLLRPGNLHVSGRVEWTEKNTRNMPETWAEDFPNYIVGESELVMNLTAQSLKDEFLGRICMTGAGERCLLNQRIARLTPISLNPRFLLWVFKSRVFRRFVDGLNTGSLIQHMFTRQLQGCALPLPPAREQSRLTDAIERFVATEEHIEQTLESLTARISALRQSILKWAFEGRLVDQDSGDEAASGLLERIRKEREAMAPKTRRRKKKPTA